MSEPRSCRECGAIPVIVTDEFGVSCVHICRGANGMGGAWNYPTFESAVIAWNEYLGEESDE